MRSPLALASLIRMALLACGVIALLAACGNEGTSSTPCSTTCSGCADDERCIATGYIEPVCLKRCDAGQPCSAGLSCWSFELLGGVLDTRRSVQVCASRDRLVACGDQTRAPTCTDYQFCRCTDDHHAVQNTAQNGYCASFPRDCPTSCTSVDGGINESCRCQ